MQEVLQQSFTGTLTEAGCDEAGRGCLAGPVFAAAVILPDKLDPELAALLNDSKKLAAPVREQLRVRIEKEMKAWSVAMIDHQEIDRINILQASIMGMHAALGKLSCRPQFILVDGNRFRPYEEIPHQCVIKGDGLYLSIAAASILAKTHRDRYMQQLHEQYPMYGWDTNKGYPTPFHRAAVIRHGMSPYHRRSFRMGLQLELDYSSENIATHS